MPADDSMGALELAYIDAAEVYHKLRSDVLALNRAIAERDACYAAAGSRKDIN